MSTDEYTPTDEDARESFIIGQIRDGYGADWDDDRPLAEAWFERWFDRVRRDAAREALDGLVDWSRAEYDRARHESRTGGMALELHVQQAVSSYSRAHYPEETP